MLQPGASSDIRSEVAAPESMPGSVSWHDFVGFVRRQISIIIFVTLLFVAFGIIYSITARPTFIAQAELMIDARKLQVFQQQSILGDIPIDTAQVESQVEVLKSENIALSVIKNLHLTEDPEFVGSNGSLFGTLLSFVSNPFEVDPAPSEFELTRSAVNAFESKLSIKRIGLTYVIQIGFQSFNPERASQIANAVADAYIVDQLEAKYQATRRASTWLQDRIKELRDQVATAERAVVDFKTKNNIVSTGGPDKRLVGEQQVAELSSQLVIARANSAEAKARLDRIQSVLKTDAPNASFGATVTDTLKNEVVSKLRSQYLELAAREADWTTKYGANHLAVVNLRNQLREIRNSIFDELKRLGETYKSDYAIAKQREFGVQNELAQAVAQSQATDAKSVTLRELQSTAQTYKSLYDNFLQRYMEAVQQQSFPITEARLISSATRPLSKSHPRTRFVLFVAGLGGLVLGFGIGALRDLSDRVFRTSEQVEDLLQTDCICLVPLLTGSDPDGSVVTSGPKENPGSSAPGANTEIRRNRIEVVAKSIFARLLESIGSTVLVSDMRGTIKSTKRRMGSLVSSPSVKDQAMALASPNLAESLQSFGSRIIKHNDDIALWAVTDSPFSVFTEAIRSIKLAVDLNGLVKTNRVIGFTSSLPNEGKSTVAAALAQLMSQTNTRTILIDCDLRNPSISRSLAPKAKIGLLDVISGKVSLEEAIWKDPSTNLEFLPVAAKNRLAHSNEILSSLPVKKIFDQLRERYDYVIVDFPPIAPIVDVRATAHLIDSFIFVVEWGNTNIEVVRHALGHAQNVYENMLGVVLNKVDRNVFGRYAGQHEGYYYNKYYGRYGYTE